jgi:hypothetical protein
MSWDAGLELQSPLDLDDGSFLSQYLRARGEGLLGFVYRVGDLDATIERVGETGWTPLARMNGLSGVEPWADRFAKVDEAMFGGFYGATFALAQIEEAADG